MCLCPLRSSPSSGVYPLLPTQSTPAEQADDKGKKEAEDSDSEEESQKKIRVNIRSQNEAVADEVCVYACLG